MTLRIAIETGEIFHLDKAILASDLIVLEGAGVCELGEKKIAYKPGVTHSVTAEKELYLLRRENSDRQRISVRLTLLRHHPLPRIACATGGQAYAGDPWIARTSRAMTNGGIQLNPKQL